MFQGPAVTRSNHSPLRTMSARHPSTTKCVTGMLLAMTLAVWSPSVEAARPNIIVILADDMGYSDIGCYGSSIQTPQLDKLAANGVRLTQFYNTARCCPTRACLMSGLYPHQAGVGWMMSDLKHPGYRGDLNRQCVTIAEVLGTAGYKTYMAGKWHVTPKVSPDGPKHNWPRQRGFDRFYGTIHGAGSFYDPNSLTRGNQQISPYADPEYKPETYYYTDAISDHAVRFINEHPQGDDNNTPFFMYVAYTAAHWPMHALPKDIAKYKGKYDAGYAAARAARFQRVKQLGLIDPAWSLTPQAGNWDNVANKAWEAACMEVYAAMIDNMDQGIGRIVAALRNKGQLENTLIMYMQDNGGCAEGLGRNPRGKFTERPASAPFQPMRADALQTAMIPKQTRDGFPLIQGPGRLPGPADTYIAYGRGWANVSNTPFREYKHWVHEGGIATPLVAHWPQGIPAARNGKLEPQPGHLIDIMATCVDASGATYPTKYKSNSIQPMEGKSLIPVFRGQTIERDALYWEHEGNVAIRVGKWKAVAKYAQYKQDAWELYDMDSDRTETRNLAARMPEKLAELKTKWLAFAKHANFLPVNGGRGAKGAPGKNRKNRKNKPGKNQRKNGDRPAAN